MRWIFLTLVLCCALSIRGLAAGAPIEPTAAPTGPLDEYHRAVRDRRAMVVNFSAAWCTACIEMQPVLDELEPKWKDRVTFIAVDIDTAEGGKFADQKDVTALPTFLFVNRDGKVVARPVGPISRQDFEKHLEAIGR